MCLPHQGPTRIKSCKAQPVCLSFSKVHLYKFPKCPRKLLLLASVFTLTMIKNCERQPGFANGLKLSEWLFFCNRIPFDWKTRQVTSPGPCDTLSPLMLLLLRCRLSSWHLSLRVNLDRGTWTPGFLTLWTVRRFMLLRCPLTKDAERLRDLPL